MFGPCIFVLYQLKICMNIHRDQELVEAVRLTINNGQGDSEALQLMAKYGFGPEQWQAGSELLQRAEQCFDQRTALEHERWALSQQINESLLSVNEQFKEHAQAARFAFRQNPSLLHSLEIDRISSRRWESVRQAAFFYRQLQNKKLSLQAYGISPKAVQQAVATIDELLRQREQRTHRSGRAQHSTQEKRTALTELRAWIVEFRGVARLAFRQQPQLLEIFGMRIPSTVKVG